MKVIFKLAFFALAILFVNSNASAQAADDYTTKIDSLLKAKNPRSFNGVVLIQKNGKQKYAKAYGFTDFNKKSPLKMDDNFSTMSIAKQFTAALIMQQVEKGTIDLHTPIRKYLPDFKHAWADTVTVHHLLNNTSGLQSENMDAPLKFKPGTAYSYSNIGYHVAGLVLEKQSGKSFESLVTVLFKKCKMSNSYYPTESSSKKLTKGHTIKKDGAVRLNDLLSFEARNYFGSHLIITAPDLARWNDCLHGGKLLKPATYTLMTNYSITAIHQLFSEKPIGYGYGLRINDKDSISEIGHTGYHPSEGFTAVNLYYPKTRTSVIVLENTAFENFDIAYYIEQEVIKIVKTSTLLQ